MVGSHHLGSPLGRIAISLACAAVLVACAPLSDDTAPTPTPTAVASQADPVSADLLSIATAASDAAVADAGETVVASSSARPTRVVTSGVLQTIALKDVSTAPIEPGEYTLTVYCGGSGAVVAELTIDTVVASGPEQPCGAAGVSAGDVHIDQQAAAKQFEVHIVPVGDTTAAVSYVVTRAP